MYHRSLESGDLWYTSRELKKAIRDDEEGWFVLLRVQGYLTHNKTHPPRTLL